MIDITLDYYDDDIINSLLEKHVPRKPRILHKFLRNKARRILKSYRMYESSSIREVMDNYEFLNRKKKLGILGRFGLSERNNHARGQVSVEDLLLYNQYSKLERKSALRNLNCCILENVCINVDPNGFIKRDSFELCELQLMENSGSDEYIPATFIYRDGINGIEKDNLKNTALLGIMLESNIYDRYDLTLQTMDEDYEIYKDDMTLLRGKKLLIRNIDIHDDEGYRIPDYEPLLDSAFK